MEIHRSKLMEFANRCLIAVGVPEQEASIISNSLVEADARGIHSHGLMRLPIYIQRMEKGLIRREAKMVVEQENRAAVVLDGNHSAGQVVATYAMNRAIAKAEEYGIGAVAVKNSNHFGVAAHYAMMASHKDMIGIVMSNTAPLMPPVGGAEKIIGNNPFAMAAPTDHKYPLVLDMALSQVAFGKILYAKSKGLSIPEGWGADKNGNGTTDPRAVLEGGFLLPLGGPKGFGLALMIEVVTAVLAGGAISKMIPSMYDLTQKQSISHLMVAIRIASFTEPDRFKQMASVLSSYVKEAKKASGIDEIYLPGEIELSLEEKRNESGIPISDNVIAELNRLAETLQVPILASNHS
jgi:LDH2 family malate/lactate/ureidoglycolate dehydrogenase